MEKCEGVNNVWLVLVPTARHVNLRFCLIAQLFICQFKEESHAIIKFSNLTEGRGNLCSNPSKKKKQVSLKSHLS